MNNIANLIAKLKKHTEVVATVYVDTFTLLSQAAVELESLQKLLEQDEGTIYATDMKIDGTYSFDYTSKTGETKRRYVMIDDMDAKHIYTTLLDPEENVDEPRTFLLDNISNIKSY